MSSYSERQDSAAGGLGAHRFTAVAADRPGEPPVSYTIEPDLGALGEVIVRLQGRVTVEDLSRTEDVIRSDSRYRPGMPVLVDCRVLTEIPSHDQIRALAFDRLLRQRTKPTGKLAIVAMTRMGLEYAARWEMLASDDRNDVRVFTNREHAAAWLLGR